MAKFESNDDGVVVVIGSGAGGGTLSNELAQKGINVVCLEAGGHGSNRLATNAHIGTRHARARHHHATLDDEVKRFSHLLPSIHRKHYFLS